MHLEGIEPGAEASEVMRWQAHCAIALDALRQASPPDVPLAVENLAYPWQWHDDLVAAAGARLCCDVGHLWRYTPETWQADCRAMLPRANVLHVHGVDARGKDHRSLTELHRPRRLDVLLTMLREVDYDAVFTLEVFNEADFVGSAQCVREIWDRLYS
jgi:sugar phosphate isomerase/epimerase